MIANQPGSCDLCGLEIFEGDDIEFTTKQSLAHVSCIVEERQETAGLFDSYDDEEAGR